ncbi:syntaxin-12-like isoform X2 [Ischnura elegans]|uniref:syntaxin-12-like isoform X2 n=1 Tax=Ischnura elegans TaxID=197161 RepID=UPI001ED8A295|nr:syntaxin-12-like isoform X2 [Ischnura elegans]XP_046394855.1 syntaxin-12-like isoform X2 [Ischnura elegans]
MSQAISSGRAQRNYGSTSQVPAVGFSGPDFNNMEFNSICDSITTNLYTINTARKTLEKALKTIEAGKDNEGLRDSIHVTQMSTNEIISQTQKEVQELGERRRGATLQIKLQVEKLIQDYKEAVQLYSNVQQSVAEKMKMRILPTAAAASKAGGDALLEEGEDEIRVQAQAQAERKYRDVEFETGLLVEREQRIRMIETDVLDINQIMRELSALTFDQGEAISSIENNTETVHSRIEEGRQELLKAAEYQAGYRRKTCVLLGIAAVVVIVLVTILAVKLG